MVTKCNRRVELLRCRKLEHHLHSPEIGVVDIARICPRDSLFRYASIPGKEQNNAAEAISTHRVAGTIRVEDTKRQTIGLWGVGQETIGADASVAVTELPDTVGLGLERDACEIAGIYNDKVISDAVHFVKRDVKRHPG